MSREVWFRHKPGLIIVGLPVHWKGWVLGALFAAALVSVILIVGEAGKPLDAAGRQSLQVFGALVGLILTLAFLIAAWPHRAPPPK